MINYEQLKKQLIRHEGLRLKPYRCTSNKLTIGVGRNLDDKGLSEFESIFLLENDISDFEEQLHRRLPNFRIHSAARQAALINVAFNIGVDGLLGFKKMLNALDNKDYEEAAAQLLDSRYAQQVGMRANELANQIQDGEWQ